MRALLLLIAVAIVASAAAPASARRWHGLEPLRSTRADVVRQLGRMSDEHAEYARYETESEIVLVRFTSEAAPRRGCRLAVRSGTVASISIQPKVRRTLRDFGLSASRMRRFDPTDAGYPEYAGFVDARSGVVARTHNGAVDEIVFVANEATRRRCRAYAEQYDELEGLLSIPIEPPVPVCQSLSAERTALRIGERVNLTVTASDPDGDVLTYTWTATCGRIIGSGSNVTFDATGLGEGPCTVTASVSDGVHPAVECSSIVITIVGPEP